MCTLVYVPEGGHIVILPSICASKFFWPSSYIVMYEGILKAFDRKVHCNNIMCGKQHLALYHKDHDGTWIDKDVPKTEPISLHEGQYHLLTMHKLLV